MGFVKAMTTVLELAKRNAPYTCGTAAEHAERLEAIATIQKLLNEGA